MKRALVAVILIVGAGIAGWNLHRMFGKEPVVAQAQARTQAETRILATLEEMQKTGGIRFGVPEADGRRLRLLAEAIGAKHVVEIGTSTGYSALWLALGVLPSDGRVTTFEIDPGVAATARQNFRKAGVDGRVTVIPGDAHKTLATLEGPIDMVFLDADKDGYVDYFNKLLPLVRRGGLILAHNTNYAAPYMERVTGDPGIETVLLSQGSAMSVTLKKR
jgi:caffeoyl-CoA O-methyltransferase